MTPTGTARDIAGRPTKPMSQLLPAERLCFSHWSLFATSPCFPIPTHFAEKLQRSQRRNRSGPKPYFRPKCHVETPCNSNRRPARDCSKWRACRWRAQPATAPVTLHNRGRLLLGQRPNPVRPRIAEPRPRKSGGAGSRRCSALPSVAIGEHLETILSGAGATPSRAAGWRLFVFELLRQPDRVPASPMARRLNARLPIAKAAASTSWLLPGSIVQEHIRRLSTCNQ